MSKKKQIATLTHVGSEVPDEVAFPLILARIKSQITMTGKGCWEWQGWKNTLGYGEMNARGRRHMVHRLMYEITYSMKIHQKLVVCHTCDVPACCNPEHLWIGTEKQNMRDAADKKRWSRQGPQCKRGHAYMEGSFYIKMQRGRTCRVCLECERLRGRLKAGWPLELAQSLPVTPPGQRPVNAKRSAGQPTGEP